MNSAAFLSKVTDTLTNCGFTNFACSSTTLRSGEDGCWLVKIGDSLKSVKVEPIRGYLYMGLHSLSDLKLTVRVGSVEAWSVSHVERVVGHVLRLVSIAHDYRINEYHSVVDEASTLKWKIRMLRLSDAERVRWSSPSNDDELGKFNMSSLFVLRSFTLDQAMRIADVCREVKQ